MLNDNLHCVSPPASVLQKCIHKQLVFSSAHNIYFPPYVSQNWDKFCTKVVKLIMWYIKYFQKFANPLMTDKHLKFIVPDIYIFFPDMTRYFKTWSYNEYIESISTIDGWFFAWEIAIAEETSLLGAPYYEFNSDVNARCIIFNREQYFCLLSVYLLQFVLQTVM